MSAVEHVIPHDAVYPRDEENRYRLYGRIGDDLRVIATAATPEAVGTMLVQIHEDGRDAEPPVRLADYGRIGILDVLGGPKGAGEWVLLPWDRGATS